MSDEKKDGGQAFPMVGQIDELRSVAITGMSLRQWYAGQALVGLLASEGIEGCYESDAARARHAFAVADAMIEHEAGHD